ncbi:MAG: 5'-nucleotidase C-terminal domain-containing protein [Fimbriimonadaceae bacterium]|nr:5'-nucleotidase C-terminal domain-containing protein [Fimbriimonadaceae bacterium]
MPFDKRPTGGKVETIVRRINNLRGGATCLAACLCAISISAPGSTDPGTGASDAGQAIADLIRDAASCDAAWVAAGLLKPDARGNDLGEYAMFGSDTICIVKLTGKEVRAAVEHSLSLYPSPNPGFLQVSGLEIKFRPSASAERRVTEITMSGSALNPESSYRIAMPSNLARGGLGYFMVWDERSIEKTLENLTVESLLKGQTLRSSAPRWIAN